MKYVCLMAFTYKGSSKDELQIHYEGGNEIDFYEPIYPEHEKLSGDKKDKNFNCWVKSFEVGQQERDHFEWPEDAEVGYEFILSFNDEHPMFNGIVLGDQFFNESIPYIYQGGLGISYKLYIASRDIVYYFIRERFPSMLK